MRSRQTTHTLRGLVALSLLFVMGLTACTRMGPIAAREYIPVSRPSSVWVTRGDNAVVQMQVPRLLGDTLVGYVNGEYQEMILSQTKQVQARVPQPGRTVLAIGAGVAGVVGVAFLIAGTEALCVNRRGGDGFIMPC